MVRRQPESFRSERAASLDEILEGAMLVLSVQPTYYPRVEGTILRTLRTEEVPPNIPSYMIFFTFNMHKVTLEWIEHTDPDA